MNVLDANLLITFLPFSILVVMNFNYTEADDPCIWSPLLKVLPLVWLILCAKYFNKIIGSNSNKYESPKYVIYGLMAAVVGDICLVWPKNVFCLTVGIVAFSFTHYFYAKTHGFHPIKLKILFVYCIPITSINLLLIFNNLQGQFLRQIIVACVYLRTDDFTYLFK